MCPRISVITITYNSAATLEETIRSVTSQDYPALEYVIIDGGSTDGTLDIVQKYKDQIQVVVSEPDNGISDAFNKGISRATGEIMVSSTLTTSCSLALCRKWQRLMILRWMCTAV